MECGAAERNRTPDLLITNQLLYRLSYSGFSMSYAIFCLLDLTNCRVRCRFNGFLGRLSEIFSFGGHAVYGLKGRLSLPLTGSPPLRQGRQITD